MILVIAEQKDGKLNRASLETIAAAQQLSGGSMPIKVAVAGQGVAVDFVDATDVAQVEAALKPETRMVFVETIANPRTQVADLAHLPSGAWIMWQALHFLNSASPLAASPAPS